jgi:hypothetical protein
MLSHRKSTDAQLISGSRLAGGVAFAQEQTTHRQISGSMQDASGDR